jgi:hypothetical protein
VDPADTQVPVRDIETDSDFVRIASPVLLRAQGWDVERAVAVGLADAASHGDGAHPRHDA